MGCFFGCFRVKDDNRPRTQLFSGAGASKETVRFKSQDASRNQLASLFLSEEKEGSPCKDKANHVLGSQQSDFDGSFDVKELKDEAKFLKACGTLLETPDEIRKVAHRVEESPFDSGGSESSKFHSWLPSTSVKKLQWEEQPDQVPNYHAKLHEELQSFTSAGEQPRRNCAKLAGGTDVESPDTLIKDHVIPIENDRLSSVTPGIRAPTSQYRCVRFECESGMNSLSSRSSSSEASGQRLKKFDAPGSHIGSKPSPYPTPLKLSDEMQTPGTVYPVNEKNTRIRSQYVYPLLNPVQDSSEWKALKEEDSATHQQFSHLRESLEENENASPEYAHIPSSESATLNRQESVEGEELKVEASLSQWIKSSSTAMHAKSQNCEVLSTEKSHFGKVSERDRPIIGMVAAHWKDDEPTQVSPKGWDGKGIPNSTNKYKEDRKVSWHATPFEERLEKALSEESFISQRTNISGKPIDFEEDEDGDSAVSQLQHLTRPKSVISF